METLFKTEEADESSLLNTIKSDGPAWIYEKTVSEIVTDDDIVPGAVIKLS